MFQSKKPKQFKKFKTAEEKKTKTGSSLVNYCYWLLSRRDYSKEELLKKLKVYALNDEEAVELVERLEENKYVDDNRVANSILNSQLLKGSGLRKIQQVMKNKGVGLDLVQERIDDVDWFQQAYDLKIKKFGEAVAVDQKEKNRQIRFLQYRGFDLDVVFKVVGHQPEDF